MPNLDPISYAILQVENARGGQNDACDERLLSGPDDGR